MELCISKKTPKTLRDNLARELTLDVHHSAMESDLNYPCHLPVFVIGRKQPVIE